MEGKWEEGAEGPLALMFRDGDSGFGVEDDDEAERGLERKVFICKRLKIAQPKKRLLVNVQKVCTEQVNLLSRAAEVLTPFRPF